jgi:hypothetical protein
LLALHPILGVAAVDGATPLFAMLTDVEFEEAFVFFDMRAIKLLDAGLSFSAVFFDISDIKLLEPDLLSSGFGFFSFLSLAENIKLYVTKYAIKQNPRPKVKTMDR